MRSYISPNYPINHQRDVGCSESDVKKSRMWRVFSAQPTSRCNRNFFRSLGMSDEPSSTVLSSVRTDKNWEHYICNLMVPCNLDCDEVLFNVRRTTLLCPTFVLLSVWLPKRRQLKRCHYTSMLSLPWLNNYHRR